MLWHSNPSILNYVKQINTTVIVTAIAVCPQSHFWESIPAFWSNSIEALLEGHTNKTDQTMQRCL